MDKKTEATELLNHQDTEVCPLCSYPVATGHAPDCPHSPLQSKDAKRTVEGKAQDIIDNLRPKILHSLTRYYLAWYMRESLDPSLRDKLDQFRKKEETSFSEQDEMIIQNCCESIFSFFGSYFPEEYFEELAEIQTETPQMTELEQSYREQTRAQIQSLIDGLLDIQIGLKDQFSQHIPQTHIEKFEHLLNELREIQTRYCYTGPIRNVRDQQTLSDSKRDESLRQAINKFSDVLGDMRKYLTNLTNMSTGIAYYQENDQKLKTHLTELRTKKPWVRRLMESVTPAAISSRERKIQELIAQNNAQLVANEASLAARSDPNEIGRFLEKLETALPSLGQSLESQLSHPILSLEGNGTFDQLVFVRVSDRPLHLKGDIVTLPCLSSEPFALYQRMTTHFTVNCVVDSHMYGNWDNNNCVYLLPARTTVDLNGTPDAIGHADTWYIGDVVLPHQSIAVVSPLTPPFQIGPEKLERLKIVVSDDALRKTRSLLAESGLRNSDLYKAEVSDQMKEKGIDRKLAHPEAHYDSVYQTLEAQGSQFILYAILKDENKTLNTAGCFLKAYFIRAEKNPPKSRDAIRLKYRHLFKAMERFFTTNGYNFEALKQRCAEFDHQERSADFYRSFKIETR